MPQYYLALAAACFGYLGAVALLVREARDPFSPFMLLMFLWYAVPQGIAAATAFVSRRNLIAGCVALVGAVITSAIGVGIPFRVQFIDRPDANAAIAYLFVPLFQLPSAVLSLAVATFIVILQRHSRSSSTSASE